METMTMLVGRGGYSDRTNYLCGREGLCTRSQCARISPNLVDASTSKNNLASEVQIQSALAALLLMILESLAYGICYYSAF